MAMMTINAFEKHTWRLSLAEAHDLRGILDTRSGHFLVHEPRATLSPGHTRHHADDTPPTR